MPAPTIVSSNPASAEANVYKNKVLTVTFSEGLLSATVNQSNFILRNLDISEIVPVDVSLSTDGTVVSITPTRHLVERTSYKLMIVGADTAVGTPLKASDGTSFATTTSITFSTGTEVEASSIEKTLSQIEQEGEISLPSNITINYDSSELRILDSSPKNRAFSVDEDLSEITVTFSQALDTSTVTPSSFAVIVDPYYEEDDLYLAYPDTSDGSMNFKWQSPTDDDGVLLDFSDMAGDLSVDGNVVTWTKDGSETRNFPRNTAVKIIMNTSIESTGGNTLDGTRQIQFFITPFPNVVSVDRVRDEFFPFVLTDWTDDMIGKTIYKNSIDALNMMRWSYNFTNRNRTFHQFVLCQTVVDIFENLRIETDMKGGQFKRLGDLTIRYDKDIGTSIPAKIIKAMECARVAKDALRGRYTKSARSIVKGEFHPEQKAVWRTRLWRQEISRALEEYYSGDEYTGNSRSVRATKVMGSQQIW